MGGSRSPQNNGQTSEGIMLEDLGAPIKQTRPCAVRDLIAKLDKKDQEILTEAIANP